MSDKPPRVSFTDALAIISANCRPAPTHSVAVADALGLVLASDVKAVDDFPRFDCSAMDGFALSSSASTAASPASPVRMRLEGMADAGAARQEWAAGVAVPISTGAPMPFGCDAVLVRERGLVSAGHLHLTEAVRPGANVRRRGEDVVAGEVVMTAGAIVDPPTIGALLSFGVDYVVVRRQPCFAVLPTGDELQEGCSDDARIRDANGPMVAASLRQAGYGGHLLKAASDEQGALQARLDEMFAIADIDIVITTGGVSTGTRDIIPALIESRGGLVHFHGISMRPGKPVLFATLPDGRLFFGLPGNPVAALLGCRFLVQHAFRMMLGIGPETEEAFPYEHSERGDITRFLKVLRVPDGSGCTTVTILPGQQSHRLRPLLTANAWLRVGGEGEGVQTAGLYRINGFAAGKSPEPL